MRLRPIVRVSNPHGKLVKNAERLCMSSGRDGQVEATVVSVLPLPLVIFTVALWFRVTPPGAFKVKRSRSENLTVLDLINTRGPQIDT